MRSLVRFAGIDLVVRFAPAEESAAQ